MLMTDEERVEVLARLLSAVLATGVGYEIDMYGMLYLRPLEDGTFAVGSEDSCRPKKEHWEKIFKDPFKAARAFEAVRRSRSLGFDYEQEYYGITKS